MVAKGKAEQSIADLARRHTEQVSIAQRRGSKSKSFGGHLPGNWPMISKNLGCCPEQIPAIKALLKRKGVKADFTADGKCIVKSQRHLKAIAEARNLFAYNGGYSDPQPTQVHTDLHRINQQKARESLQRMKRRFGLMLLAKLAKT